MDGLNLLYARSREFYEGLTPRRRQALLAMVGVSVALVVGLSIWAGRPQWTPVIAGLEPAQAQTLVQTLREGEFQVKVQGDRLLVPAGQVEEARLVAYGSEQGSTLPGMDYLLEKGSKSITRFEEKVTFQVALQGELARTLSRLDGVKRASVRLVMPEPALFREDRVEARASVDLELKSNNRLTRSQVGAVTNLVASSVPNLAPSDVVVTDTTGYLYTRPIEEEDGVAAVDRMLEIVRAREKELQSKAKDALNRLYADDRTDVQVTLRVDTATSQVNAVDYDGSGATPSTTSFSERSDVGGGAVASGVPGSGSNLPEIEARAGAAGATAGSESTSMTEESAFLTPRRESDTRQPAGRVERVSVAVLVDQDRETDEETGEVVFVPRTEEELKKITDAIVAAVGVETSRGDVLTVVDMPFVDAEQGAVTEAGMPIFTLLPWGKIGRWLLALTLLVLAYRYVARPVIQSVVTPQRSEDDYLDGDGPLALLEGRSPEFRRQLVRLTGHQGDGDPLVSVLQTNLPISVRALRDWIEEG
ncbi:MAG: flagellar basal-body MS-ring/collar protein FliF [Myxococcota bacterium]|nr:flagellar basal-body MS-ring/collar protein FliF [Myxococcota bacterium]